MRILLTNDDGIHAKGIWTLAKIVSEMADELYIVAPDQERSGVSHSITVHTALDVKQVDFPHGVKEAYSCSGTPADCVKAAVNAILPERPDFVLSGINHGYNIGFDTVYSGTVAAARDAAYQGIPSVAISSYSAEFTLAEKYLKGILTKLFEENLARHEVWNVNFPACEPNECKGVKMCMPSSNSYYKDTYSKKQISDKEWQYKLIDEYTTEYEPESDFHLVKEGYISVGKLACDTLRNI